MKRTNDRQFTTYLRITGAPAVDGGVTVNHVRIDVSHDEHRKAYVLSVHAVERKADGGEACLLSDMASKGYYGKLADAPRYSAKQLAVWASVIETCIAEENGYWDKIAAVVQAHGARIAK